MGLFGKKKPAENVEQNVQPESVATPSKKKKKDTIGSVLHESVLENVLEELRENKLFTADVDGQSVYVTLALSAADIGGLSKSTAKGNEAKGSIIECINSGRIKAIVTQELINMDMILFIPDVLTMDAMDEFGLLTDVDYKIAFVNPEDGISVTEHVVSFERIKDMVDNDISVDELMDEINGNAPATPRPRTPKSDDEWDDGFGSNDGFADTDDDDSDASDDFDDSDDLGDDFEADSGFDDDDDDDVPFGNDDSDDGFDDGFGGGFGTDFGNDAPAPVSVDPVSEDAGFGDMSFEDEFRDAEYPSDDDDYISDDDYAEPDVSGDVSDEPDEGISEEQMRSAIVRTFYSDELGLEVTTAPFDAQFMQDDNLVLFDEDRDTSGEGGWLAGYLNQMAKDANNELMRLHQQNLRTMRTQYFQLISLHCEKVQKDLDTNDGDTQFGQLMDSLKRQKLQALGSVDRLVSDRKREITDTWEKTLERVGEEGRNAAIQQYSERYGRQHDDQLQRVEPEIKRQIEDQYQDAVREMLATRKSEASKLLDYGITETMRVVTESYLKMLDGEQALYEKYRQQMTAFVDEHRQTDIARANALAEELRQSDKADVARAEGKARIEQLIAEFDAKKAAMQSEIDAMRRANEKAIADKEAECNNRIKAMEDTLRAKDAENERLREQYDKLMDKLADVDARKGQEYESRINEMRQEKLAWQDKYDHTLAMQKRSTTISVLLVVAAIIASLAIGLIFGMRFNINDAIDKAQNTASYQQTDDAVMSNQDAWYDISDVSAV